MGTLIAVVMVFAAFFAGIYVGILAVVWMMKRNGYTAHFKDSVMRIYKPGLFEDYDK